jgi:hypothetical protein
MCLNKFYCQYISNKKLNYVHDIVTVALVFIFL